MQIMHPKYRDTEAFVLRGLESHQLRRCTKLLSMWERDENLRATIAIIGACEAGSKHTELLPATYSVLKNATSAVRSSSVRLNPNSCPFTARVVTPNPRKAVGT